MRILYFIYFEFEGEQMVEGHLSSFTLQINCDQWQRTNRSDTPQPHFRYDGLHESGFSTPKTNPSHVGLGPTPSAHLPPPLSLSSLSLSLSLHHFLSVYLQFTLPAVLTVFPVSNTTAYSYPFLPFQQDIIIGCYFVFFFINALVFMVLAVFFWRKLERERSWRCLSYI